MKDPVIQVQNLATHFQVRGGTVRALDGVSFQIKANETVGIVGESGCGKTTLGRTLVGLIPPTNGTIVYNRDVARPGRPGQALPGMVQMVFQDPYTSFNPRMRVEQIVAEPLIAAGKAVDPKTIADEIEAVGLDRNSLDRYPHQFSGGQRQRLAIARAMVTRPALLVADEAVSALDVSVQAQILNLLADLKERHKIACLFISHDLSVVEHLSDRIAVMYAGQIVEIGPAEQVIHQAHHPYTRALLASLPEAVSGEESQALPDGEAPSPMAYPTGCRFHPRCRWAEPDCRIDRPSLRTVEDRHQSACLLETLD